jgi:3-hydroxyisobutyrate dehydrogenase
VLEAARRHDIDLPMLETIKNQLLQAAREHGDEDLAATYLASAPRQPAGRG